MLDTGERGPRLRRRDKRYVASQPPHRIPPTCPLTATPLLLPSADVAGICFVIDATNDRKFPKAARELHRILEAEWAQSVTKLMVMANFQDLGDAHTVGPCPTLVSTLRRALDAFSALSWRLFCASRCRAVLLSLVAVCRGDRG